MSLLKVENLKSSDNIFIRINNSDKIKLNLGTRVDSNGEKLYEKEYLNNYLNDEITLS